MQSRRRRAVPDTYHAKLADVLVGYSTRVREGDVVLIESPVTAAPLLREVFRRVVRAGGHPQLRLSIETMIETLLRNGSDDQLEWVNPVRVEDFERADVRIVLLSSTNTKGLTSVDPSRQALYGRAHEQLGNRYLKRAAAGELRWTLTQFPTHAAAQDAEMSLEQYERFVYRAGLLDERDPIGSWRAFSEYVAGVARF